MSGRDTILFGPFRLIPAERRLLRGDDTIGVGNRALDILIALTEVAGEVVCQAELLARAWPNVVVGEGSLRVTIASLRKVLGDGLDGVRYISNVTGRGYCFVGAVERLQGTPTPSLATTAISEVPQVTIPKFPDRPRRMIGRDGAVETLSKLLISSRFVSVVGPGGMGKTTVAVSVGNALLDVFAHAVYFVDLSTVADPAVVPNMVAAVLGLILQTKDPLPNLLAFLAERRVFLVLDNCEHVINAVALLAERVYSEAPHAHIMTTSREALRVEGEHVHLLAPLDYPLPSEQLTAADALATSAVQLFMDRASAAGYTAELTDADALVVAEICGRLDGIAYAIELAASRVATYGLQGTADLLSNRFKLLWQGRRSAPPRQQTLTAMLDWSFNLLSKRDQRVLARLSIFVGVFTLEAAQFAASCDDLDPMQVAEAIAGLIDKSLILIVPINGILYHRLLDPTSTYAAEKLRHSADASVIARKHALCFEQWLPRDGGDDIRSAVPHMGNIRAALEWCFSAVGDEVLGARLAVAFAPVFFRLSFLTESKRWCEQGLAALEKDGGDQAKCLALRSILAASSMFTLGNSKEIQRSLDDALKLAEFLGEDLLQMDLLAGLSIYLTRIGDFNAAVAVGQRSIPVAQRIGTPSAIAISDWMLGVAYHLAGDQAAGRLHLERGLAEAKDLDSPQVIYFGYDPKVRALIALARCLWLSGFSDRAAKTARLAIDQALNRNHPVDLCISMIYATTVFLWRSDLDEAERLIERIIGHASKHALIPYQIVGRALTGELAIARGEPAIGAPILRRVLNDLQAIQYHALTTAFQRALAEGLLQSGEIDEAACVIDDALARSEPSGLCELLRVRGEIWLNVATPNQASAEQAFQQSLQQAKAQSALSLELRSAMALARLWSSQGKRASAADLLRDVRQRFTEGFQTADLMSADQLLATLERDSSATQSHA
jgi:predicted ATPase/DNA-binding winged helix-turn-helix (wHTH) protein